jgi:glutamate synthase domain-containing protein 2/glutamate synthase domain-containing protein 1/glutamate synthase domain-containing protein 3
MADQSAPLYDRTLEHDACGVGFVADARGGQAARVLPLALAGLAALGHRGAFAADGQSSDGAGVLLPLERALLDRLGAPPGRPGVVQAFLPRRPVDSAAGRRLIEGSLAGQGLTVTAWRPVPVRPDALGEQAAATRPMIAQAFVTRPAGLGDAAFETRLTIARRRAETSAAARWGTSDALTIPSASCRTTVYKALVSGSRLAEFYPDLEGPSAFRFALFHQRFATNTAPEWRLAQPFRRVAHNGEINTVRGNREQFRGRVADPVRSRVGRELLEAGSLLSADGSDSLALDEALEVLVATGWLLPQALLTLLPDAPALRGSPSPRLARFKRRTAGFLAPWDGPAALVAADGRFVAAILDRNGLRPAAFAMTGSGLVAVASEAGAVPLGPHETTRRGRLGPGELILVDLATGAVLEDEAAKAAVLDDEPFRDTARPTYVDASPPAPGSDPRTTGRPQPSLAYLAGLDAERQRLDLRTMALEGHEPLWSMGDDTPLPSLGSVDRRAADHLRQAFAQVTNPPIDAERERVVMDLRVELGPRAPLLGGPPSHPRTVRLERPFVADVSDLMGALRDQAGAGTSGLRVRVLSALWSARRGPAGLGVAIASLAHRSVSASRRGAEVVVLSDRGFSGARLPIPSVLAIGAVHAALAAAGRRGRTDIVVEAADVLDVHSMAMALASGATCVAPWLALATAGELAGGRGAETVSAAQVRGRLLEAFEAGLRKTLARAGLSTMAAYVGSGMFETVELAPEVVARCFPAARAWPGRVGFDELGARQLQRRDAAGRLEPSERLPDHGLARFRADGERHLFAPRIVQLTQTLAEPGGPEGETDGGLTAYRFGLARPPAVVRDSLIVRRPRGRRPLDPAAVEPVEAITRRFIVSAMSVGALSPEAHQALTLGIQRVGGAANTGEGGEDPAWYAVEPGAERRDARIKQVASARFGVTAAYLARADQVEIKMAQGSKPGEGGQLPGRKVTAYIAGLRRAQPGQALISPPPHHDIYSIEDLAQLIADLRAINPGARIGVKLVATRGVGTIAAGVAKAGASYIHLSGHSGGTGASPLASIKHVGVPFELGLAEVHQVLVHHGLRDRVTLRTDGGLQTGRDLLVAALLGAEEFAFGTAVLVALGCDMARQCHLDTCPTGIATQRDDLRAKFTGTPERVVRFATALAQDLRRELAAVGASSVAEVVGAGRRYLRAAPGATLDLDAVIAAPAWSLAGRRAQRVPAPASAVEIDLVARLRDGGASPAAMAIGNADRSFGAVLSGAMERGEVTDPVSLSLSGSAGQSFGAFAVAGLALRLAGQANDYVAKGLSGGMVVVAPEPALAAAAGDEMIAGNACLYGATAGRVHLVGRAGQRFAVRNSGAEAVVEGVGPHGCEYMTGGVVVILGPVGANFGAGMSGGRAYLLGDDLASPPPIHAGSVVASRLAARVGSDADGWALADDLFRLLMAHREAGSAAAGRLLAADRAATIARFWLVEPVGTPVTPRQATTPTPASPAIAGARPLAASGPAPGS